MTNPWADVREELVRDLGEMFAQRFDELPDDYKPTFVDILAFLRGDTLAPEMTAMKVAESRRDRDALLTLREYAGHKQSCELPEAGVRGICDCGFTKAYAALPEHLRRSR